MAETKGKLCSCDRCGAEVFLKTTGDGEADGGYTQWNKFEPYPAGWGIVDIPRDHATARSKTVRVCPKCNTLWRSVLNEHFLKGTKHYMEVDDG